MIAEPLSGISLLIGIVNLFFTYKGLKDFLFFDRYVFHVDRILIGKDYKRLITSGFLHLGWMHFAFNMFSLYAFGESLELFLGAGQFAAIYFVSLMAGNLFALYVHRNHGDYSAAGASGAVSGVIFASIAVSPGIEIGFFGIEPFIPGWLYGVLFVLISIYGIKSKSGNIGHEAHLGGAIAGLFVALAFYPEVIEYNYVAITLILIPAVAFIFLIIMRPHILLIEGYSSSAPKKFQTIEDKYNMDKNRQQEKIDAILEKIGRKGMGSLTKDEKEALDAFSRGKR